jgi:shikimate kinase
MRIILVGVDCVGKSTLGKYLADEWNYSYIHFIFEVEKRMGSSIEKIREKYWTNKGFRDATSPILRDILDEYHENLVIVMSASGLYSEYVSVIESNPDVITVWLKDRPKNIMERLTFYDEDSKLIPDYDYKENYEYYYNDLKGDIEFYRNSLRKAKLHFDINGMDAVNAGKELARSILEYTKM